MGILQVLRFEFGKFRILEILNFHPCQSQVHWYMVRLNSLHAEYNFACICRLLFFFVLFFSKINFIEILPEIASKYQIGLNRTRPDVLSDLIWC